MLFQFLHKGHTSFGMQLRYLCFQKAYRISIFVVTGRTFRADNNALTWKGFLMFIATWDCYTEKLRVATIVFWTLPLIISVTSRNYTLLCKIKWEKCIGLVALWQNWTITYRRPCVLPVIGNPIWIPSHLERKWILTLKEISFIYYNKSFSAIQTNNPNDYFQRIIAQNTTKMETFHLDRPLSTLLSAYFEVFFIKWKCGFSKLLLSHITKFNARLYMAGLALCGLCQVGVTGATPVLPISVPCLDQCYVILLHIYHFDKL